ncbi:putative selenium-dependent hydroxylase accessory protein YqeC [Haloferax sp. MBLA0076]|uniref:Putative selenium-dependent hydroxylase accessory protein YqeC n=1 Tax=Haloferax litoreum TaxID=2666140 RepID=A0A6A8GBG9_9EURY|nr:MULTISPECIES: selenium cofactor biosynthesis protein YqeC [Haloferax]KAB1192007.1 putative selenium-dependent hydroxylase accessory protein YqeC [Haloferax sp. CBA1148]MRX20448.1 putative selenium-dependent hydroxylase accessory protein YqeC [Haloferax litoreum]
MTENPADTTLADALGVGPDDLTCMVGAGGKKSLIYRLARSLDGVVTSTVRIPIFDDEVAEVMVTDDPATVVEETSTRPLGVVPERERADRYRGYDPETVDTVGRRTDDVVLTKADGARSRWLKAPADHEPRVPHSTTLVCPVASVRVVGEPLEETHVHRPALVSEITGTATGDPISAWDVAAVLTSDRGGMKDVPETARIVPVLNMVDGETEAETAERIAGWVREHPRVERVVATRLVADDPIVDIY